MNINIRHLIIAATLFAGSYANETSYMPFKKSKTNGEAFAKGMLFGMAQGAAGMGLKVCMNHIINDSYSKGLITEKEKNIVLETNPHIADMIFAPTTVIFATAVATNNDANKTGMCMLGEVVGIVAAESACATIAKGERELVISNAAIVAATGAALSTLPAVHSTLQSLGNTASDVAEFISDNSGDILKVTADVLWWYWGFKNEAETSSKLAKYEEYKSRYGEI